MAVEFGIEVLSFSIGGLVQFSLTLVRILLQVKVVALSEDHPGNLGIGSPGDLKGIVLDQRQAELDKPIDRKGQYLNPELYGHSPEKRIGYVEHGQPRQATKGMVDQEWAEKLQSMEGMGQRKAQENTPFTQQESATPTGKE